jgi:transposase
VDGNGSAATAMLGLAGFVLLAVSELGGEVEQAIETTERVVGCPGCGVLARLHDRRPVRVRDLPAAGRAVTLIWVKRIWRCVEPGCSVATWTERSEAIRPRASLTERARLEACRRVGQDGHTVAQVASQLGVGWATIMAAVIEYGLPLVDDPARLGGVSTLGVDETAFLGAGPRRSTTFVTGIVDLSGPTARLLDVVPGRSANALSQWVNHRPPQWRDAITVAALDPFRGYATALTASLPSAVRVLDCFHVTRSASPPWTTSAAECSRRRPGTAAAATTRSIGSDGCCAAEPTGSPSMPGSACSPASRSATPASRSAAPGSPPKTSG